MQWRKSPSYIKQLLPLSFSGSFLYFHLSEMATAEYQSLINDEPSFWLPQRALC